MVEPFINRKHGKEPVEYDHPLLEPVLRDTYGVIIYQEQVMRAAQALAGYTLEEADILRAAMGKKNKARDGEGARALHLEGAMKNGVDKALGESIFEKIETFASYGFNRSHAAAYALTTYTTAYLKAHYPREFMAALMSLDMDDIDKTYKNIAALREMRIRLLPPDVNQSRVKFTVAGDAIRFGLGAIRGVGAKTAEAIIAVREQRRPVQGPGWISACASARQSINRRVLEALIKCGAFDSTATSAAPTDGAGRGRAQDRAARRERRGQESDRTVRRDAATPPALPRRASRSPNGIAKEMLQATRRRRSASTSPPIRWTNTTASCAGSASVTTADLPSRPTAARCASPAWCRRSSSRTTSPASATRRSRSRIATARSKCIAWPETYQKYEAMIMGDEPVVARGKLDVDDERAQIILDELRPLGVALIDAVREVRIRRRASAWPTASWRSSRRCCGATAARDDVSASGLDDGTRGDLPARRQLSRRADRRFRRRGRAHAGPGVSDAALEVLFTFTRKGRGNKSSTRCRG